MTKKRDMKWALEEAISALTVMDAQYNGKYGDVYKQAADMLRNGGRVVEHSQRFDGHKCRWCDTYHTSRDDGDQCVLCGRLLNKKCKWIEYWTEREKIQIVIEKTEPTFEEIK